MKNKDLNKISYHRPVFSVYGSIINITQASPNGPMNDGSSGVNTMSQRNSGNGNA